MILTLSEKIYGALSASYHRKWDNQGGWKAPVPVISVGNLTVGGNGKTPFVIELVKLLSANFESLRAPHRIAVLSRGYGRRSTTMCFVEPDTNFKVSGDEPLLIKRSCPQTLVISHAQRVESARIAVDRYCTELIILDDGFQHRSLARDLNIVLLDAERPLDNGHLLPAGRLREHPSALNRADLLISVGRGGAVDEIARKFARPVLHVSPVSTIPKELDRPHAPVFLLTAVARPQRVRQLVEESGLRIVGHAAYRDHHVFSPRELESASRSAAKSGAQAVLTTSKDMIRILSWNGSLPLLGIPYQIALADPEPLLDEVARLLRT